MKVKQHFPLDIFKSDIAFHCKSGNKQVHRNKLNWTCVNLTVFLLTKKAVHYLNDF